MGLLSHFQREGAYTQRENKATPDSYLMQAQDLILHCNLHVVLESNGAIEGYQCRTSR